MRHHVILDADITYTRISKVRARTLWGKVDMVLCPVNLRPGGVWYAHMVVSAARIQAEAASPYQFVREGAQFDNVVQHFELYNCVCNETGHYTAFYLMKG